MINVHSADLNVACGTPDPILKDVKYGAHGKWPRRWALWYSMRHGWQPRGRDPPSKVAHPIQLQTRDGRKGMLNR